MLAAPEPELGPLASFIAMVEFSIVTLLRRAEDVDFCNPGLFTIPPAVRNAVFEEMVDRSIMSSPPMFAIPPPSPEAVLLRNVQLINFR